MIPNVIFCYSIEHRISNIFMHVITTFPYISHSYKSLEQQNLYLFIYFFKYAIFLKSVEEMTCL